MLALVGALAVAVLPQLLRRPDSSHALYTVTPALILAFGCAEAVATRFAARGKLVAYALVCTVFVFPSYASLPSLRHPTLPAVPSVPRETDGFRAMAVEFIRANTAPGEAIFVGTWRHQRPYLNEVALYFLADRPGASRYTQFEPNLVNRLEIQREIAGELGRQGTRVLVLSSCCSDSNEPNESRRIGSSFLDEYIAAHYRVVGTFGRYAFLVRSSAG